MSIPTMRARIAELADERQRYLDRSQKILEQIGVTSVQQLPGMKPQPPWHSPLTKHLGWSPSVPASPPDSFWTSQRRRLAEETKVAHMQAGAAAKKINQYLVEIHKKISIPFACIVFVLVGAPLGIRARRGGLAAGFLSAGFFLFYYLCLVGGEQLADRQHLAPWLAMWLPNIALGVLGLALTLRICEVWRRRPRSSPARP